jgi:quercetin dioxygenase-like cupin family protein
MLKKHYSEVENNQAVLADGTSVKNVFMRWLVSKDDGAQNFAMRRIEIKPGGEVPLHGHLEEHEIYILKGEGKFLNDEGQEERAKEGDVFFIPPSEKHSIVNLGENDLAFLCLIPYLEKEE